MAGVHKWIAPLPSVIFTKAIHKSCWILCRQEDTATRTLAAQHTYGEVGRQLDLSLIHHMHEIEGRACTAE